MRRLLLLLVWTSLFAAPAPSLAQTRAPDLAQLSIEDLMRIEVTSAGRKRQPLTDVAAAAFVITHDDIRRSGMTSIPDLLRMAPGVDVAQIDSSKWAVTVRGFNGLYANKLLVLVDGRSVYNRLFSGAIWDANDLMLDDVDRIEVIRGPGAAMWGANAMNGVINIVTKSAADTQGGLVRVDAGRSGQQGGIRYGGTRGEARYRVYAQWTEREQSLIAPGTRADDASRSLTTGFRTDWGHKAETFSFDGRFTAGRARGLWTNFDSLTAANQPFAADPSDSHGGHLLGRWTHTRAGGQSLKVQSFVDLSHRHEPVGEHERRAFDIDTQYRATYRARHDIVVGAGYRFVDEKLTGRVGVSLVPPENRSSLVTGFIQDEIAFFGKRLAITLGSQIQYDSDIGTGVQPTARAMWKGLPNQRLWVATSRSLRTPALTSRGIRLEYPPIAGPGGLPLFITLLGDPAAKTERFVDAEAGYRLEIGTTGSIDVTGFVGHYSDLATREVQASVVQFVPSPRILVTTRLANELAATTRGLEVVGVWAPVPSWRLDGSYTLFDLTPHLSATSRDPVAKFEDGRAPRQQWRVRSSFSPAAHATVNIAVSHVGPLELLLVEAYTRADINMEVRFTDRLSVMAIGQNLFKAAHFEFGGADALVKATQVPRSAGVRLRWTF
ncbi:MAG: TonB-dependent receptor [Vicinamibacterales bacterium]|jgi:iron complex outermembrane receptor protein